MTSADGADHAIEVRGSLSNQSRAVTLNGFHLAELGSTQCGGICLADVRSR